MTPTLLGRIQTRLLLIVLIGLPWTILVTPFLPARRGGVGWLAAAGRLYPVTLTALAIVAVVGSLVWEPVYHGLQQFRWEKDWPVLFALLNVVNEAIVAWFILRAIGPTPAAPVEATGVTFAVHIVTTWLLMWLVAIGPIRIVLLRWRFRGGRIL